MGNSSSTSRGPEQVTLGTTFIDTANAESGCSTTSKNLSPALAEAPVAPRATADQETSKKKKTGLKLTNSTMARQVEVLRRAAKRAFVEHDGGEAPEGQAPPYPSAYDSMAQIAEQLFTGPEPSVIPGQYLVMTVPVAAPRVEGLTDEAITLAVACPSPDNPFGLYELPVDVPIDRWLEDHSNLYCKLTRGQTLSRSAMREVHLAIGKLTAEDTIAVDSDTTWANENRYRERREWLFHHK